MFSLSCRNTDEGYETELIYPKYLEKFSIQIQMTYITDNKLLYDVTDSLTSTTGRLRRTKIATIRQLCERKHVILE